MNISPWLTRILAAAIIPLLGGCGAKYSVAGSFEKTGLPLYGEINISEYSRPLMDNFESGTMKLALAKDAAACTGDTETTKWPSDETFIGRQRTATVKCPDGQTFKIDLIQNSETGGYGQGVDGKGNVIRLFFDESKDVAQLRMKMRHLDTVVK